MSIIMLVCFVLSIGVALFSIGYTNSFRNDFEEDRQDLIRARSELAKGNCSGDSILYSLDKTLHQSVKEFKIEIEHSKASRVKTEKELDVCKSYLDRTEKQLIKTERLLERTEHQLQSVSRALERAEVRIESLEHDNAIIKQKLDISYKVARHSKIKEPFAISI